MGATGFVRFVTDTFRSKIINSLKRPSSRSPFVRLNSVTLINDSSFDCSTTFIVSAPSALRMRSTSTVLALSAASVTSSEPEWNGINNVFVNWNTKAIEIRKIPMPVM
jgi:hypothetical protein